MRLEELEPRILLSTFTGDDAALAVAGAQSAPADMLQGEAISSAAATPAASASADPQLEVPLAFEENRGQTDAAVDFFAQGSGQTILLSNGDAELRLSSSDGDTLVRLELDGTRADPYATGADPGTDNAESYGAVRYGDVYDGIDVRYAGSQRQLECEFVVSAGADPDQISLRIGGADSVAIDATSGDLLLGLGDSGEARLLAPVSYQLDSNGERVDVECAYQLRADGSIGIALGAHDASREIVIVPVLDSAGLGPAMPVTLRHELVILDPGVQNFAALRDLLTAQRDAGRDLELFVLDANRDGVEQIAEILAGRHDLDAVHVLSHGTAEGLQLGNTWLDAGTINDHAEAIRGWQTAFGSDADLLLYGCDLASSDTGKSLVDTLGEWTGTDVAASSDLTGTFYFGGDWDLEYRAGSIETAVVANLDAQRDWVGLMSVAVDATSTGTTTGTSLTISHPTSGTNKLMVVAVSMRETGTESVSSVTYKGDALTFNGFAMGPTGARVEIWSLVAPSNGPHNVVITLTGAGGGTTAGVMTFTGVDQAIPLGAFGAASGDATSGSASVGSAPGELVFGVIAVKDSDQNLIPGAGQTERWDLFTGTEANGGASTEAGAASVALSWTWSASTDWAIGAVAIKPAAFVVTNTNNTGAGSLRQAILDANAAAGADVITFAIAGAGVHTIAPTSALPTIDGSVTIDATTQPGFAGTPLIRLDGASAGANLDGLTFTGNSDGSTIRGLMITRFTQDGIAVQSGADNITIAGNWIGTTGAGSTGVGNADDGIDLDGSSAVIGGTGANDRNVITNSGDDGIDIVGSGVTGHLIQGNYIGLDPDGSSGGGNADVGIAIISGSGNTIGGITPAARNVISMNREGIEINTSNNVVQGNYIGTDASGTLDRGQQADDGIEIQGSATGNLIGGTTAGAGNLVAFNFLNGVNVVNGSSNQILRNSIYSNSQLGIDLGANGITSNDANDADAGANSLQNFPVLTSVNSAAAGTTLVGTFNSNANTTYRIEFFGNRPTIADSPNGEGERFLGFATITTDGAGNAALNTTLANVWVNSGDRITATATNLTTNDTSEFAANVTATSTGIIVVDTTSDVSDGTTTSIINLGNARGADGRISLREAIAAANNTANGPFTDKIVFDIPLTDANHVYYRNNAVAGTFSAPVATTLADTAITDFDADYVTGTARSWYRITLGTTSLDVTQAVIIDGSTQAGYDAAKGPVIEINAAAVTGGDANAIALTTGGSTIRGLVINRAGDNAIEIDVGATSSAIVGNYIGTDVSGTQALGNSRVGTWGAIAVKTNSVVIGGTTAADRNLISGNLGYGIEFYSSASNAVVQGNYIGTTVTGSGSLGNSAAGVYIRNSAASNTIGGAGANEGNLIASNGADGIWADATAGTGNRILGNSIHSNAGLGVDLGADGVTPNDAGDADTGANNLQNFPVLSIASSTGGETSISGSLNSTSSTTFRIEFFSSPTGDASAHGEARTYLGATTVTTDASGNATFSTTLTGVSVATGHAVSATATVDLGGGTYGSTSEFAANLLVNNSANVGANQDTYLQLKDPTLNYGTATSLVIDRESTDLQRALLQFDLSAIPVNATITSATLTMQATQVGGSLTISVYEMLQAWTEGSGNGSGDAANWDERAPGTNWSSAGGSFNATSVASLTTNATGQHSWTLTTLVQAWVDGSKANNGLMVASPDGGGNRTATYDSSEGATPPQLVISYTVPANAAPTLDATRSPALGAVAEDAGAPVGAVGTLVSSLVDFASPAGQVDNVTDSDAGAQLGIAITSADAANGTWWHSTNNGGSWTALGAVSGSSARLLAADAGTRLYFQPNADYNGSSANAISFRAWDRTSGVNGGLANTTINGGSTAFSSATDSASLTVTAVNDAPNATNLSAAETYTEDTALNLTNIVIGDVDSANVTATLTLSNSAAGSLNIGTSGTVTSTYDAGTGVWSASGAIADVNTLLAGLTFAPAANVNSTFTITTSVSDGVAAPSTGSKTMTGTAVNDAPTLSSSYSLGSIAEDDFNSPGTLVANMLSSGFSDPDAAALQGIAVVGVDNSNGTWQYTLDGTNWSAIGNVTVSAARLLPSDAATAVRFVPNANYNGPAFPFSYKAWDQTAGIAGGTGDASISGGTTAFSTGTSSTTLTVLAVNDAPTLGNGTLAAVNEDTVSPGGQTVAAIFTGQSADIDTGSSFFGIAVVGNTADSGTQGTWQYSSNGGTNWFAVGTVADDATALAIGRTALIRFAPVANYSGTPPTLMVRGLDDSYASGFSATAGSETRVTVNTTTNGGTTAIAAVTANLSTSITAVNDAPIRTAGSVANLTVLEDSAFTPLGFGGVAFGPGGGSDESGQSLSYAVTVIPSTSIGDVFLSDGTTQVTLGTYSLAQIQGMQFRPTANASGITGFQFDVTDSGGTGNGGSNSLSQFILITVTAVNDAPTIANLSGDSLGYSEGAGAVVIEQGGNALVADVDSPDFNTGTLTVSLTAGSDSAEDVLSIRNQGTGAGQIGVSGANVTYSGVTIGSFAGGSAGANLVITFSGLSSPAAAQALIRNITFEDTDTGAPTTGARTVRFVLTDGDGGTSANHDSTVTVSGVNDAPVAANDSAVVTEGGVVTIDLAVNDTDVDNALDLGSIAIVSGPTNGSLVLNGNGTVTYTHNGWETLTDSFTYTIRDASGAISNTATVTLTVTPVNDAPVAANDSSVVAESGVVTIDLAANDTDADNALDLGSIAIVSAPTNGSLVLNGNGTVTYTHNGWETLTDSFTYTIRDASGAISNTATVTLTVTPVNDAPVAANDSSVVAESGVVTIDLAANDTDADNALDLGSIAIVSAPTNGSLVLNGNGTVTYTHDGSETLADSFTYTIRDASGAISNTATVSLTVTPVNDAPMAANDSALVAEGGAVTIDLAANDTDADNALDLGSIAIVSGPSNGSLVLNGNGTVTYTHDGSGTLADSFTYTIRDASGAISNTATVSLTVTPVNDAPVAANDSAAVAEGGAVTIDLAANDTDADNALDLGSIAIVSGPTNGSLVLNGDGTVTYTHNGSETLADSFTYTIRDASGAISNTATVSLTVTPVNDAPVAANDSALVAEGGAVTIDLAANDTDADNALDLGSIAIVSGPANGSLVLNGNGTVSYTHDGSGTVSDTFTYTIRDASGAISNTATVSLTVTPVNDAPVAANDAAVVAEGGVVTIDLAANDTDADDALDLGSIAIVSGPTNGSLVLNGNGTVTYTHNGSETLADSFSYTIRDATGAISNTATVSLTVTPVNDVPVAANDSAVVAEGGAVTIDLAANDADADNALDLGSIAIVSAPANGSLVLNGNGTVTYTHNGSETLADSFTYTIRDASGAISNTATVSLTVTPVNDAPVAANDSAVVAEGGAVTIDLAANDADADNALDLGSIAIVSAPANGSLVLNGNGTVTYTHNGSETLADSFTYTIRDASGAISNTATVSLTVTPVNDAPVAANDAAVVAEGGVVTIDLAANDTDADDALDLGSIAIVSGPANGSLVLNGNGTVTYTHDGSGTLADSFTYTIRDASGAISNTATVSLTVTPVNDAPVAANDASVVVEGGAVTIDLAANDTDADNALDLGSIAILSAPTNGSLVLNGDGTVTYTHDGSETLADSFTYTIRDASGAISNTATVSLTVTPVNDAPVAANDSALVAEGGAVTIDLAANDTDADNALDLGSIAIVSAPANGSLVLNGNGTVTYTHDGSGTVSDSFTYTIRDASGAISNTATVSLTVTPVNDAPVATNDSAIVAEGGAVTIDLAANDTDADNALDLGSIAIVSGPSNGSLVLNGNGTVTYTHNGSETLSDSFTYTIRDASGVVSNTATVSLTVTPVNDAPVAANDLAAVAEGGAVTIDLAANDTDADNALDLGSIAIVSAPANGSLVLNGNGTVTYTHNGSETLADSFTYTIRDASGAVSNTATVSLTVTPLNDAPVAANDSSVVAEGGAVTIDLAANDTDADNALDLGSIAIVSGPTNGSLVLNGDGTVTYTHDGSETVGDSFTYTIRDASGAISNTATVSLTVTPVNDAPVAANDSSVVAESGVVTIDLAANDSDADNALDLGSIAILSAPANGSLVLNGDGTVTYTHDGSETVGDSFTYTIRDASGAISNTATVSLTVTPVNDAPVAANDSSVVAESGVVTIDLAANDSDADNALDLGSIAILSAPANGSLVLNGNGTVTYTHNGSETLADSFTYTIRDASGAISNTATVSLTVTPVNDAPVAANDASVVAEGGAVTIDLAVNDTDADNALDLGSIAILSAPTNGSLLLNGNGTVTYTHNGSETLADSFTYTIRDATGAISNTATVSLTVTPVNDAPVAANDSALVAEGGAVTIDLAANDADADNALDLGSIAIVSAPANGSLVLNGNGTVSYTHDGSGTVSDTFTYTIRDASGAISNTATVSLTVTPVNDAPVAANDAAVVAEGGVVTIDLAANDTDADDALDLGSIAIVSGPTNGSLVLNGDGTVTYTHDGSETLADSFTYTIRDASGAITNTAMVSLTVTPVNDAPVAANDAAVVAEGGVVTIDLAANDTDADDALDLGSIAIVSGPANGSLVLNGNGTVTYTHDGSGTLADSFTYTIRDASGAISNTATVSLTVTPVNDAPVAANDASVVVEGGAVTIDLAANDTDADNALDLGSIAIVSAPANGSLVLNGNGTVTYTHNGSETLADSFTYTIRDASGAVSNTATVSLTVTPVNDAPVAANDSAVVAEGGAVTIDLAANDTDADNALDLGSIAIVSGPTNGSLVLNGNGTVTYTHNGSGTLADSFTYTIRDATGAISNTATVSLTVTPVNDAPTSAADAYTVTEDTTLATAAGTGVLANDFDADLDALSAVLVSGPASAASFTLNPDGSFVYVPSADFSGSDSFTYVANDGTAVGALTTVVITVSPVNDAPVALDDIYAVDEDAILAVSAGAGVLANDIDVDGDALTTSLITGPLIGSVTLSSDGSFSYQPTADFAGVDSFSYVTSDGASMAATRTVTVTVNAVNDAPLALAPGGQSVSQTATLIFSSSGGNGLAVSDSDSAGQPVQITLQATNGLLRLGSLSGLVFSEGDGVDDARVTFLATQSDANLALEGLTFSPGAGFSGAASLQLTVNDTGASGAGGALSDAAVVAIDVTGGSAVAPVETFDLPPPGPTPIEPGSDPVVDPTPDPTETGPGGVADAPTVTPIALGVRDTGGPSTQPSPARAEQRVIAPYSSRLELDAGSRRDDNGATTPARPDYARTIAARGSMYEKLDQLRRDVDADAADEQRSLEALVARLEAVAVGLSAGAVAMLLRGGSLVALAVSSLPLWGRVDPLAVLAVDEKERRRRERAALETASAEDRGVEAMFREEAPFEDDQAEDDETDEEKAETEA